MDKDLRKYMLFLSREAITDFLRTGSATLPVNPPEDLIKNGASFVTLQSGGKLRGCIGTLEAYRPLYSDVFHNSLNAAFKDPRFRPVSESELERIRIEISVLSARKEIVYTNYSDLKTKIIPGSHGVYIQSSSGNSTFLPQVWDQLPEQDEFLAHLCIKAGLPANYLTENKPVVEVYTVESFKE